MKELKILLLIFLTPAFLASQTNISSGNQVAFKTTHPKTLVLNNSLKSFEIKNSKTNKVILRGISSKEIFYPFSNETVRIADFSSLTKPGKYYLESEGYKSQEITISKNPYEEILKASTKAFYLTRASQETTVKYAGTYARPIGHPDTIVYIHSSAKSEKRPENTIISSPGGWYDAGDYNKYIVNSGITCFTLLRTYEIYKKAHQKLNLNIPESSNKKADLLDEIEYNINWMLTMQDPNDGGVYHKLTHKRFNGFIKAENAPEKRYVVQKSVTATLDFAAVIAYYARLLDNEERKTELLKKSEQAFEWALKNPKAYYIQPEDVKTGEYGDKDASDELFWASVELYISTNNKKYEDRFKSISFGVYNAPAWPNVKALGIISLSSSKNIHKEKARKSILKLADQFQYYSTKNAYGNTLGHNGERGFNWGSNSNIANQTIMMIEALKISKDQKYIKPIFANIYYLLGQNPTGYCFVTGFGTKRVLNPHHRLSATDGVKEPYPGLLVGGPNRSQQDVKNVSSYPSKLPALSFTDDIESYASNEIAINWNAPLVYVLSFAHKH